MDTKNNELPLIGEIKAPADVPMALIERCETKEDAIRLCWCMRRDKSLSIRKASERLRISKTMLSKIIDGLAGMRGNQERAFQYLCGNRAITQFQAWELDCCLVDETWEEHQKNKEAA